MTPEKRNFFKGIVVLSVLTAFFLIITILISRFNLDLKTASVFYTGEYRKWLLDDIYLCEWLYRYGTIPGLILTVSFLILFLSSFIFKRLYSWRRDFLLCFLVIVIGGGIIVNAVLKDHFGRPRPRQVTHFGGSWEYLAPLVPGIPGKGKSFPCGHCAMGFASVAGIFLYYRSKKIALASALVTIVYGSLVSITRIGQGAHFLSDTIASLGVLLITGAILFYFIIKPELHYGNKDLKPVSPLKLKFLTAFTILTIIIMTLLFLTRRPVYDDMITRLSINQNIKNIEISTNVEKDSFFIFSDRNHSESKVIMEVKGFGFPNADTDFRVSEKIKSNTLYVYIMISTTGYYSEKNIKSQIIVPPHLKNKIKINFSDQI